jgi:hypothetical protein
MDLGFGALNEGGISDPSSEGIVEYTPPSATPLGLLLPQELGLPGRAQGSLSFTATEGTTYYIAVDGRDGDFGNVAISCAELGDTAGGSLPAGAVGLLDFVNGHYIYGSNHFTADQVVSQPWRIVPGVGLAKSNGDERDQDNNSCFLLGQWRDYLLTGSWTMVIEFGVLDAAIPVMIQTSDANVALGFDYGQWYTDYEVEQPLSIDFFPDPSGFFGLERDMLWAGENDLSAVGFPQINCVATTRTDARAANSFNGSTAVAIDDQPVDSFASHGMDQVLLFSEVSGVIGRIVIYPPQLDADLAALSVVSVLTRPSNDDFANAATVGVGQTFGYTTYLATREVGEPDHFGDGDGVLAQPDGVTIWFKFTAPETRSYEVSLLGSQSDEISGFGVAIYTGAAVNALTLVAKQTYNYNATIYNETPVYPLERAWDSPKVSFAAVAGTTYRIVVASPVLEPSFVSGIDDLTQCPAYVDGGQIVLNINPVS